MQVSLAASGARVEADPTRLRQVLINLVKNAQEELESVNDARIQVRTKPASEGYCGYVELEIRDNGPGFSHDVLTHLFEPYVTTKVKGTGLGLAIVKKIVEEHGGIIKAENLEEGGARILIYLPLMPFAEPNNA
jgi:nitrogen fixation/metabolism regulation signal transduction histidine kinase